MSGYRSQLLEHGHADRPALSMDERIVWISDNGPEYGNVRWLGKLPDLGKDWMAGVEFDNPVGSGTGLYRDEQLFVTAINHASLVPVIGLIKASDFDDQPDCLIAETQMESGIIHHHPVSGLGSDDNYRKCVVTTNKLSSKLDRQLGDITLSLRKTKIDDDRRKPFEGSVLTLPPPALVVSSGEKNPSSALANLLGKSRGIQGHNNSCYLDATLFAMFSSTTLFDSLLYRPPNSNDISEYSEIQRILREHIVRPLRKEYIVNADQVMLFRTMLERSSTVAGLTDEEKDPEEFLSLLLSQILKAEPYLKLSSGLESFFHQLIVDKDENVVLPTVQDLADQSFMSNTVRLREIPPCLLLQMPRFGRQYKMYSRIMPSLKLDITDVLEAVPRACGHRGKDCDNLARFECTGCFSEKTGRCDTRLSSITYCANCFKSKHFGKTHSTGIEGHDKTKTSLDKMPNEAILRYSNKQSSSGSKDKEIPRVQMDLFAVLCIETSHYVCFVRCGDQLDAPWCFFDSMADRRGEQDGYNIPEVVLFDEFAFWTSDKGATYLLSHKDDKLLPEMARRLICDAYLCFYNYPGLKAYR